VNAAIVGVGSSEYTLSTEQSEERLAVDAIRAALADAGLEESAVDGMVRYSQDSNDFAHLLRAFDLRELSFYSEVPYGGLGTCGAIAHAAAAVDAGLAECVVVFRALRGRSGVRLGRGERFDASPGSTGFVARGDRMPGGAFAAPFGLFAPTQLIALWARRYAHDYSIDEDRLVLALGAVAVTQRDYAQRNPRAITFGKPLTIEEYLDSRLISTPFRLYDLCRESDGGAAVVIARPSVAGRPGVRVVAAKQHLVRYGEPTSAYVEDLTRGIGEGSVSALLASAGVTIDDVDVAAVYDTTTLMVLFAMEDYGFCGRGEAVDFVLDGAVGPGGRIPTNTAGGLLSEAYVHGINVVIDAVEQVRGSSSNQVGDAEFGLVASRGGSLILGRP
jgi:acetyl-CoA acetyltransferase